MKRVHRYALYALMILVIGLGFAVYERSRDRLLRVSVLDIGQGDAIYVRAPGGRDALIDGGPDRSILTRLGEVMPWYDRSIDVIVATHPDSDHIGGLLSVLERYHVGVILESGVSSDNVVDDGLAERAREKGIDRLLARRGMSLDLGSNVVMDILFPHGDVSHFETNTASIIVQLRYGSTSAMFTGDAPQSVERALIKTYGPSLKSNILKAGHHGSRTSSDESFVVAVSPDYAIISAGIKNRYDHPHREVTDLFDRLGIPLLRTYESGTISCLSDGIGMTCK